MSEGVLYHELEKADLCLPSFLVAHRLDECGCIPVVINLFWPMDNLF